ncbi:molybdopterin-dependent oxidoreductase [Mucilaginibacter ginkgonis]|uniref:Molybdopterin-dependent oxidoreductase n=1 Tax=Mucilaginibacter ginkgonis TaxID=2682091 RepID=A0A6I4HZ64_9SPHI|nr:molybdopterin-dependent oxidoreductase [Mucilaginibacter ginkgonis]QQL49803.1 molybdopterin-dependent oxidoreductase [Mucilaginibacter ginkgonis]
MPNDKNKPAEEQPLDKTIKRRNFISFATFFIGAGAAFEGWKWLYHSPIEKPAITAGAHKPLRKALNKTELFFRNFFSNRHLVRTYPAALAANPPRVNSLIGIEDQKYDVASWQLQVITDKGSKQNITLDQIKALPKTDIVFDFKCVEGWDQIQHWGGVKVIDFIEHFGLAQQTKKDYMGLETPDGKYYVGLDMPSALHPQTILAYEMNGKPITMEHGAPLRLIIPVKYGIKNLKRIGTMSFSNERPRDYWAEAGYDYYSGL